MAVAGAALSGAGAALALLNVRTTPELRDFAPARNVDTLRLLRPHEPAGTIAVCVPARNEERTLPLLIEDLRAQRDVPGMRVFIVDDGSTDETFDAAIAAASGDTRFSVRRSEREPPPGWLGKQAACSAMSTEALNAGAQILIFIDADVRVGPDAVSRAAAALRSTGAGLVSVWPSQNAVTWAERLIQPLLAWSWMSTMPIAVSNRSLRPSTAVACGQFLAFTRDAYLSAGGHSKVAASLTEDLDIARNLRRSRFRTVLVSGRAHARCRMYTSRRELAAGYGRWLGTAFGGTGGTIVVAALAVLAYLVPPVVALVGHGRARRFGFIGYLAAVTSRLASSHTEHGGRLGAARVAECCLHPFSALAFVALLAHSTRQSRRRSAHWKGRPVR
ncbi:glycosyltransferase [Hoyosella altamirensis]|uniref:Glycosyltransferase 2-like domain-containing protein n=1 Tax=Hoyosella altamirensis TaxID=616997 RepID=A0A839RRA0_9ACTN|nr:glycosyltransferase family 2 protein [Hoyosella altamirensis]MBB3038887.1 hypothetical protein [Hoyosella altamirensis]